MSKTSIKKEIPKFKSEDEEREFWSTHSPLDFPDRFERVDISFPNLRPSTQSMTIRVPQAMIGSLKLIARQKDVPYQSLVKVWLSDKIKEELRSFDVL